MALLVLAHVDARHGVLVVEEDLAERLRQFGLADARGNEVMVSWGVPLAYAQSPRTGRVLRCGCLGSVAQQHEHSNAARVLLRLRGLLVPRSLLARAAPAAVPYGDDPTGGIDDDRSHAARQCIWAWTETIAERALIHLMAAYHSCSTPFHF